jgi:hypothetical protein
MDIAMSDSQKSMVLQTQQNLHNFFAKTLIYRKTSESTLISSNEKHSFIFDYSPTNSEVTEVIDSGSFKARIYYGKQINLEPISAAGFNNSDFDTNATIPNGWVRIIVDESGKNLIKDSKRIMFDDEIYSINSLQSRHGLLEKNMYSFYLKPSE